MVRTLERTLLIVLWTAVVAGTGVLWGHHNATTSVEVTNFQIIEQRQREIFCEQALFNGVLGKCKAFEPGS